MRALLPGLLLALVTVSPASAGFAQDRRNCDRSPSPQAGIAACTRLLNSGRLNQADRAKIYYNRGIEYKRLKQYRRAIADYTQAIRLNPRYAVFYGNRGNAYSDLKQYRRAIVDYTQAIRLNPRFALAYYNRSSAYSHLK